MRLEYLISFLILHPTGIFEVGFHLLQFSFSSYSRADHQKHSSVDKITVYCNECNEHDHNDSVIRAIECNDILKKAQPVEHLEIKAALDNEPFKYRLATYLLIDTGIRRGELIGIRWKCDTICSGLHL